MSVASRTCLLARTGSRPDGRVRAGVVPALAGSAAVVGLASADGGYFPPTWGWAAVGFVLVAAASVLVRDRVALGRLEWTMLTALVALTLWTALSAAWSPSVAQPIREAERSALYAVAILAVLLITPVRSAGALPGGLLAGIAAVSAYALATRLLPGALGAYDPGAGYQLSEPLGYWNALGILTALGVLLGIGFAAHGRRSLVRSLGAGSVVVTAAALYFTFSRGALLALVLGAAAAVALDPARRRSIAAALLVAPSATLVIWLASRSEALTEQGHPLAEAADEGHRLRVVLVGAGLLAVAASACLGGVERRLAVGRRLRVSALVVLAALSVAAGAVLAARAGSPVALVGRQYDAFKAPLEPTGGDLERRLLSVSGNGRADYWRVAWDEYAAQPWLGAGAGSFERAWVQSRPTAFYARDAHNVYLEMLAELGPVGLALVAVALLTPMAALPRARRRPLVAWAAGAYVAFLVHAGLDWDWEVPAVTVTALFCGAGVLVHARPEGAGHLLTRRVRAGALAALLPVAAFAFVAHVGNSSLAASVEAASRGSYGRAEEQARKAARWAPWSFEPWQRLGEAQLAQGKLRAARTSFREALERDRASWELWYDLALASTGRARQAALERAARLNPRSEEIAVLRRYAP